MLRAGRLDFANRFYFRFYFFELPKIRFGFAVYFKRSADLFDFAAARNDDSVGNGKRFRLIVRNVQARRSERFLNSADFRAHVDPKLCVEVRKRFVHIPVRIAGMMSGIVTCVNARSR